MDIILFKEDWKKYPGAIVDYKTNNTSFLNVALKFKMMGVKNYAFCLALIDSSLQGIDPLSPNLTIDQTVRITIEIRRNPWYYFREIGKAPGQSGKAPGPILANRANISAWWCFFNHVTYILTQPRQTGKSFSIDHLMTLLYAVYCKDTSINLLTKDDKLRVSNVDRLKKIYEELPRYLKFKKSTDVWNTDELGIGELGNKYKTHVPNASEKRAYNIGRGLTTAILHIDEAPFQVNISVAFGAATASMGAAIEAARLANEPYGIIMTTTAGKIDDPDGGYIYKIIQDAALWTEKFYDCKDESDLESIVRKHSKQNDMKLSFEKESATKGSYTIYGCFSHIQLGYTDEWLAKELERTRQEGLDADRDYFNKWTSGSVKSPISPNTLETIKASVCEVSHTDIASIGSYITRWYIDENEIENYMRNNYTVVGIDTSSAIGKDYISFVMMDVKTGSTVCVGSYNETNITQFSMWLVQLSERYPNLIFMIENRSTGQAVIDNLLLFMPEKNIDPFKRVFNWIVNDPIKYSDYYEQARSSVSRRDRNLYNKVKGKFGFATSGTGQTARDKLYSNTLKSACKYSAKDIKDRPLAEQICALTIINGRIDHPDGGHDDMVIGWLLAHWFLTEAKNLQHYGIDSSAILSQSKSQKDDPSDLYNDYMNVLLKNQINTLVEELQTQDDEFISSYLETKIKRLSEEIIYADNEVASIDALINQAKEEKLRKRGIARNSNMMKDNFGKINYDRISGVSFISF